MQAIKLISQDLFDKIRSRFTNLEMGDETGAVTIDPAESRFFDFDFVSEGVNLGRVSISLNDLGSLKIYYSQGITENQDDPAKKIWYSFLKEMRMFAMRRLLRFDTRDVAKSNLDKNDFQHLAATQGPKEENNMKMNESRWNHKSTKKTSRAVKGTTEVIVRHHSAVDEMFPGSRSHRKNIKGIFIQNKDGERFKYPFIHPAGAFAMAQHVDHGGIPHDPAGKAIIKMSEQIAQLQEFQRQVQHSSLHDDAMGIRERAVGRLQELKGRVEALGKRHHYESWMTEFNEMEHSDDSNIMELDPITFEDYKSKFTQSNFNEELGKLFPLIHSIMQEKIDLEEYVSEEVDSEDIQQEQRQDQFSEFAEWAEAVEQGKLTDDQVAELKSALDELQSSGQQLELGPDGQTAWQFFNGLGIEDTDLEDKLSSMADIDDSTDSLEVFKAWAQENYPELLVALGMSGTEQPPTEQPPTEEPPVEQPTAENSEVQFETPDKGSMIKEIAGTVKRFYNASNENVGPFRSEEAICLEVEKSISEKYGDSAGKHAGMIAKQFMEKLTKQWEMKHHKSKDELAPVEDDGLARLKELLGHVKAKVEGLSANSTDEGMLDKAKAFGKKVIDKVAPDDETLLKKLQKDVGVPQTGKPPEKKADDLDELRNVSQDHLGSRMGSSVSGFNKTPAGKAREIARKQDHLKGQMKFTQSQGGISGPKGTLPEMAALRKLAGLAK